MKDKINPPITVSPDKKVMVMVSMYDSFSTSVEARFVGYLPDGKVMVLLDTGALHAFPYWKLAESEEPKEQKIKLYQSVSEYFHTGFMPSPQLFHTKEQAIAVAKMHADTGKKYGYMTGGETFIVGVKE